MADCLIYYRMSSDQQSDSIERQQAEVEPVVERQKDNVVRVFSDKGKSGSKNRSKRSGFLAMIEYIKIHNNVKKLYLWDLSRFTREHPFDAAEFYKLLMEKGIVIHDCKGGVYDLGTQTGRMMVTILQEMNHRYSTDLSENTTSGRRLLLSQGWWVSGAIPYGYDRRYVGPNGEEEFRSRLDTGFKKPRGWHLALHINDSEAPFVREMFQKYMKQDTSIRGVTRWLNENGVTPPSGDESKGWKNGTVTNILANRAYCGYSHIGGCGRKMRDKEAFNRIGDSEVKSEKIPEIVSEKVWNAVNNKKKKRKEARTNPKPTQNGKLSGILYCGHCRYALDKVRRNDRKRDPYVYYTCHSGSHYPGKCDCHQWRVLEKDVFPLILDYAFGGIETSIKNKDWGKQKKLNSNKQSSLENRLESIRKKISRANRRYLEATEFSEQMESDFKSLMKELAEQQEEVESLLLTTKVSQDSAQAMLTKVNNLKKTLYVEFSSADEIVFNMYTKDVTVILDPNARKRKKEFDIPVCETSQVRRFLKDIGTKVYIHWQHRKLVDKSGQVRFGEDGQPLRSKRNFEVKEVRLNCEFHPEKVLSGVNNNCKRERSPDRDSG